MADKSRLFAPYHRFCGFVSYILCINIIINSKNFNPYFFYIKTIEHLYYCHKKLFLTIYCCLIFVDVMDDYIIVRFQSQFPKSIVFLPWKNNICHILQDKWVMLYLNPYNELSFFQVFIV